MGKAENLRLGAFLALVIAVMGGVALAKGGFFLTIHEGDIMHLADIVLRMSQGQWPHLDFMTPIGVLAAAPIALFVKMGQGFGHALLWSQVLVALALLPATVRAGRSRMEGVWPYLFGLLVMVFVLSLVHGEARRAVSFSMHYNRWSWAITYVVLALAILPPLPGRERPVLDGALIGLGLAALVLIKVTYFVAFFVPVALALILQKQYRSVLAAIVAGLAVAALVTLLAGPDFWLAYLRDLLAVAQSNTRSAPGEPVAGVVSSPPYAMGSVLTLLTVVILRKTGRETAGLLLLLLFPAFVYVTFQNWGNDPQWILFVGFMLILMRPAAGAFQLSGWDARGLMTATAFAVLVQGAPSAMNMIATPFLHLKLTEKGQSPLRAAGPLSDLMIGDSRMLLPSAVFPVDIPALEAVRAAEDARTAEEAGLDVPQEVAVLNGEELDRCSLNSGYVGWADAALADLDAAGYAGEPFFVADLLTGYWLYGTVAPLKGAAPWNYGGLAGIENARYMLIPLCTFNARVRAEVLRSAAKAGLTLTEVRRSPFYVIAEINAE